MKQWKPMVISKLSSKIKFKKSYKGQRDHIYRDGFTALYLLKLPNYRKCSLCSLWRSVGFEFGTLCVQCSVENIWGFMTFQMDYNIKRHKMGLNGFILLYQRKRHCVMSIQLKMRCIATLTVLYKHALGIYIWIHYVRGCYYLLECSFILQGYTLFFWITWSSPLYYVFVANFLMYKLSHTQITTNGNLQIYFAKITWFVGHWQSFIFSEEMLHKFDCRGLTILLLYYLSQRNPSLQAMIMNGTINTLLKYILSYCLSAKTICFQCIELTKCCYFTPYQIKKEL